MIDVAANLEEIRSRIAGACRQAGRAEGEVTLVAVSKRQPDRRLRDAYDAGHRDFGENYLQELIRKRALLPDARWHAIGHIQRNKAKLAMEADLIHTVDSIRLANALEKAAGSKRRVLIEVNLGGEASKAGVAPDEVRPLVLHLLGLDHLEVAGLMSIPPVGAGRPAFAELRELRDRLEAETGAKLPQLSMGMSADFEAAILEGATLVRVGTAVFGERS